MALPDLHLFVEDLNKKPAAGSSAPPVSIRAKDLDGNFKKVTLLSCDKDPKTYTLEHKNEGIRIRDILPTRPSGNGLYVLTVQNGALAWTQTEDC
jgi:hypothetical protein